MTTLPASGSDGGGRPTHMASLFLIPPLRSLTFCDVCSCYLDFPGIRVRAAPNSMELLEHCIRLICTPRPLPRTIRILNAEFIESSDRDRLMVKLHLGGEISDWYHQTEFTVSRVICEICCEKPTRVELRHNRFGRHNLSGLEKAMSEHGVTCRALKIEEEDFGVDYWFSNRTHALDLVQFVEGAVPVKKQSDDDGVSATFFSLDICPIWRDDLIPSSTVRVGYSFVICTGVAAHGISLLDPFTLQTAFLTAEAYWRAPCVVVKFGYELLAEYLVLDIVMVAADPPVVDDDSYCLADAHVVRVSDPGKMDDRTKLLVRTHLGRLLKPGDYVLGYGCAGFGLLVKKKSVAEASSEEPRSVDTVLDGMRKDEYEELSRDLHGLRLINSSPHQQGISDASNIIRRRSFQPGGQVAWRRGCR